MKRLEQRPRLGAYCGRCGHVYLTTDWPGSGTCPRCARGLPDFHNDLPLGFVCVTS